MTTAAAEAVEWVAARARRPVAARGELAERGEGERRGGRAAEEVAAGKRVHRRSCRASWVTLDRRR